MAERNEHWPQQEVFCQRVKQFCNKHGKTTARGAVRLEEVADLFNLTPDTLRQFLQHKRQKRPRYSTLAYIAGIMECSVTEFLDDPGNSPQGLPVNRWPELSEPERAIALELLTDVISEDLTLSEKEELLLVHREAKARILRLRS